MVDRGRSLAVFAVVITIVGALLVSSCAPTAAPHKEIIFGNFGNILILIWAIAVTGVPGSTRQLGYKIGLNKQRGTNGAPLFVHCIDDANLGLVPPATMTTDKPLCVDGNKMFMFVVDG